MNHWNSRRWPAQRDAGRAQNLERLALAQDVVVQRRQFSLRRSRTLAMNASRSFERRGGLRLPAGRRPRRPSEPAGGRRQAQDCGGLYVGTRTPPLGPAGGHPCTTESRADSVRRPGPVTPQVVLAEHAVQRVDTRRSASPRREAQRRLDLQHVVERAVGADEHAAVAHAVRDVGRPPRRPAPASSRSRTSSTPTKRPSPRTSPMSGWRGLQRRAGRASRCVADVAARCSCSRSSRDHVEHGQADRARHGIAAEGVEVLHAVGERARRSPAS